MNNDDMPSQTTKTSARRRLIRGAFSAPLVMTLYSGSSLAASSNAARCIANQVGAAITPSDPGTTYVKVQLYVLGDPTSKYYSAWVKRTQVVGVKPGATTSTGYGGTFEWECVKAGNGTTNSSGYNVGARISVTPSSPNKTLTQTGAPYVAVRFDANGTIVGVVGANPQTGGSALAGTCWSSFISA